MRKVLLIVLMAVSLASCDGNPFALTSCDGFPFRPGCTIDHC